MYPSIYSSLTCAHKNAIRAIRKIKYFVSRRKFQQVNYPSCEKLCHNTIAHALFVGQVVGSNLDVTPRVYPFIYLHIYLHIYLGKDEIL